jgi:hypothetical protein
MHPRAGHTVYEGKTLATRGKQFSSRDFEMDIAKCAGMRLAFLCAQPSLHAMKHLVAIILLVVALLMAPVGAQTPIPKEVDELNALIKEVQAQQAEIAENQVKIDEKLATLAETIREARLFSSRGGR